MVQTHQVNTVKVNIFCGQDSGWGKLPSATSNYAIKNFLAVSKNVNHIIFFPNYLIFPF